MMVVRGREGKREAETIRDLRDQISGVGGVLVADGWTDGQTDRRTFAILELLLRLKK